MGVQGKTAKNETLTFYTDSEKKHMNPDLFDVEAQKRISQFNNHKGKPLTATQMRNFFNEVKFHKSRLDTKFSHDEKVEEFKQIFPHIRMLKARASYAKNRGNVTEGFVQFINDGVDNIKDYKDYLAFVMLFEAVIGFAKAK